MNWIENNWLALYGAMTGTIALLISYAGHRHSVSREKIKLRLELAPHPQRDANIARLREQRNEEKPWANAPPSLVEVFVVTVRNIGSVPAPLADVGIRSRDGARHHALVVNDYSRFRWLQKISEAGSESLEPNSSKSFNIYLRREEQEFEVISGYAIDQTGKEWSTRA